METEDVIRRSSGGGPVWQPVGRALICPRGELRQSNVVAGVHRQVLGRRRGDGVGQYRGVSLQAWTTTGDSNGFTSATQLKSCIFAGAVSRGEAKGRHGEGFETLGSHAHGITAWLH